MKIELTNKQLNDVLESLSQSDLYAFLTKDKVKAFRLVLSIITTKLNNEGDIRLIRNVLDKMPIQKELF